MQAWQISLVIMAVGAVGGVVSGVLSEDRGLPLPQTVSTDGGPVLRPGFLGHVLVGAVAAVLSWGLYGPLSDQVLLGTANGSVPADGYGVTASALAAAAGVGIGGAKWLGNYVDKKVLKATAVTAATKDADAGAAARLAGAPPLAALEIARAMA